MIAMRTRSISFAIILALVYGAFGAIWVYASDWLLSALVSDRLLLTTIQTWKGWLFVAISSGLIFVVGRHLLGAVEETEARYRLLFSASPEALVLYDPESLALVEINAAAGRLLLMDPAGTRGQLLTDLMPPPSRLEFERDLPRLRDNQPMGGLMRIRRQDGRELDVNTQGEPVTVDGRRLRLVLMVDVTARQQAEAELLRTMDGLAAANERLRELSYALSHDLQEPLRQVSGFVQLLARRYKGQLDAEADQFIQYAVEGTHRLKELIGDVERFAGINAVSPEPVLAEQVVAEVVHSLAEVLHGAGAEITVGTLPLVHADRSRLAVVFQTLLDNAVKFRRADRPCRIRVESEPCPGGWQLKVSDNGIGIDPEFREAVFSLFRRLHTRDSIPGNGTGLALARKLVESHGGRIWVEGAPDGGAIFAFTLPTHPPMAGRQH